MTLLSNSSYIFSLFRAPGASFLSLATMRKAKDLDSLFFLSKARGSPSESHPQRSGHVSFLLVKAKGVDEEARGRLSGHGFSTERREERRRMRSEFPRWGNERADESIPKPLQLTRWEAFDISFLA
jgi:hypothetical protein